MYLYVYIDYLCNIFCVCNVYLSISMCVNMCICVCLGDTQMLLQFQFCPGGSGCPTVLLFTASVSSL